VFGLPIGFQFKDANKRNPDDKNSDPRKTSLQMDETDRLASPLILKPLACNDGKAIGLAVILQGNQLLIKRDGQLPIERKLLKLSTQQGKTNEWTVTSVITQPEAKQIEPLKGESDVLQAFLDTL
jgi:CRISPR-associated protein Cmr1